ncbi:MAG: hypothetical protein ACRD15_05135 [Vicinamibacterales bacterium]
MSVRQAEEVAARVQRLNLAVNRPWDGRPAVVEGATSPPVELRGGIKLTLLSPRAHDMDRLANLWQKSLRGTAEPSEIETDESSQRADETMRAEPLVYVASTSRDEPWRERLKEALGPLMPDERFVFWSAKVPAGEFEPLTEEFRQQRRETVRRARIGIVLVSPDALASKGVQDDISMLVTAATESQMLLTWILLCPSAWDDTPLSRYQALGNPSRALSELPAREATQQLLNIAKQIVDLALDRSATQESLSRRQRAATEGPIDVDVLAEQPFVADRSVVNNASIAFLAEHHGKSLLVCGDASADVLAESVRALIRQRGVRRLRVDAMVVPHGGGAGNLNRELLELLDCDRYLIATNGERYGHPHRETIARILAFGRTDRSVPLTLVFNYRAPTTTVWDDPELQRRWNYHAIYPQRDGGGIKVQI